MAYRKRGPWKVLGSTIVYRNPWMTVQEDKVIHPGGSPGIFGIVTIKPGAAIIPLDDENNVYLIKEHHYATNKDNLEAASGGKEKGENYLAAAKRELKEETGISAKKWISLGVMEAFTTYLQSPVHLYLAERLSFSSAQLENTETIHTQKVPLVKALKLIESGKIVHAATVIGLLKIARLKGIR